MWKKVLLMTITIESFEPMSTSERPDDNDSSNIHHSRKSSVEIDIVLEDTKIIESYECEKCHKRYTKKFNLKIHQHLHFEVKFTCKICRKTFSNYSRLKFHTIDHIKERNHVCEVCEKAFYLRRHLQSHLKSHSLKKELECSICSKNFKTRKQRIQHENIHTGNFDRPHTCPICNKFYFTTNHLKCHIKTHANAKTKNTKTKPPYTCEKCGKHLLSKWSLKRHMFIHTEEKPYTCKICNKDFCWSSTLKLHTTLKHSSDAKYRCKFCYLGFMDRVTFLDHQNMHLGIKQYQCELCSSKFTRRANLRTHKKVKHGHVDKKQLHECEFCGKIFTGPVARNEHIRKHTGYCPLRCKICGKSYSSYNTLQNHIFTHTLPYECGICKKRFSGKTNLLKHLKHHEPKQVDNSNGQVELTCEQSTTKQGGDKSIISDDSYNIDVKNEPCILNTDCTTSTNLGVECHEIRDDKLDHFFLQSDVRTLKDKNISTENCTTLTSISNTFKRNVDINSRTGEHGIHNELYSVRSGSCNKQTGQQNAKDKSSILTCKVKSENENTASSINVSSTSNLQACSIKTEPSTNDICNGKNLITINQSNNKPINGNTIVMKRVGSFKVNTEDLKQILNGGGLLSVIKSQLVQHKVIDQKKDSK